MKKNGGIKTVSFEQVVAEASRSREFREEYAEELLTLRLAEEIKKVRNEKKLTQAAVAKKAKMPQSVIARIESGKHTVSLGTLDRIAHALDKKVQIV